MKANCDRGGTEGFITDSFHAFVGSKAAVKLSEVFQISYAAVLGNAHAVRTITLPLTDSGLLRMRLTDVWMLEQSTDSGLSLQLLMIWSEGRQEQTH